MIGIGRKIVQTKCFIPFKRLHLMRLRKCLELFQYKRTEVLKMNREVQLKILRLVQNLTPSLHQEKEVQNKKVNFNIWCDVQK